MSGPVAGWYEDPSSTQHSRWWDGQRWTDHTRLATPEPAYAAPTSAPTAGLAPPPAVAPSPTTPSPTAPGLGTGVWSAQPTASSGAPNGSRGDGRTLAIASLVCAVLWLFWLGSMAAIVTGTMALRRKVTGGHQAMAIIGLVLGGVSFLGAPVITAVAIPVFLDQRAAATEAMAESDLRIAAVEMEMAYTTAGRYPSVGSSTPIEDVIPTFSGDPAVDVTIVSSDDTGYCLEAAHEAGASIWYDSRAGGVLDVPCG